MYDEHDDEAKDDGGELEQPRELFLPLSVENLEHHHVEQSSRRQTLQGVDHHLGDLASTDLGDENPSCDTQGAGETEYTEVGVEYESLGAGLQQLQAHTEGDDKLVTCHGCKIEFLINFG